MRGTDIPPNMGFYDVPNQGHENVPGDFCGGDGSIGDVIPDGMFRAYVTQINDYEVGLDLICVYRTPQDDTIYQVPDGYVTNNNERVRWMPINDGLTIHGSAEGHGNMHYDWDVPFDQSMDAWVGVYGGRVHFIVSAPSSYDDGTYTTARTTATAAADPGSQWRLRTAHRQLPVGGQHGASAPPINETAGPASTSTRWRWSSATGPHRRGRECRRRCTMAAATPGDAGVLHGS